MSTIEKTKLGNIMMRTILTGGMALLLSLANTNSSHATEQTQKDYTMNRADELLCYPIDETALKKISIIKIEFPQNEQARGAGGGILRMYPRATIDIKKNSTAQVFSLAEYAKKTKQEACVRYSIYYSQHILNIKVSSEFNWDLNNRVNISYNKNSAQINKETMQGFVWLEQNGKWQIKSSLSDDRQVSYEYREPHILYKKVTSLGHDFSQISFGVENPPGHWEGIAHYSYYYYKNQVISADGSMQISPSGQYAIFINFDYDIQILNTKTNKSLVLPKTYWFRSDLDVVWHEASRQLSYINEKTGEKVVEKLP